MTNKKTLIEQVMENVRKTEIIFTFQKFGELVATETARLIFKRIEQLEKDYLVEDAQIHPYNAIVDIESFVIETAKLKRECGVKNETRTA